MQKVREEMINRKTKNARYLRKNQTDAGAKIWYYLRNRQLGGCKFKRQVPIGPYIADFLCNEKNIIIEIDGSQHIENNKNYDNERTRFLEDNGYSVLRFLNNDIFENLEGVLSVIWDALKCDNHSQ